MKVLLLTASYGAGHHQVASALADAFSQFDAQTCEFDCISQDSTASRSHRVFGEWLYETITRYAPGVYGLSYTLTRKLGENHLLWRILSVPLRRKLARVLTQYKPDAVLQLFPERVLLDVRVSGSRPWTGMIVTDYSVHRRWFHAGVQAYFLPDQRLADDVRAYIHEGAQSIASGIPLRSQFWTESVAERSVGAKEDANCVVESTTNACDEDLLIDMQRPYVLLASGGRGLFPDLDRTLRELVHLMPDHHVYVMCGKNAQMRSRVQALSSDHPQLHAVPFVSHVALWYRNASFAVLKAGGLTVSECFTAGCPMLLYRPQPGQEADNAAFVSAIGAGQVANHWQQLAASLELFAQVHVREKMRAACLSAAHPNAAQTVAQWVVDRVVQDGRA